MDTVSKLALGRVRFNKSRTLLTMLAVMLTTTLLAGLVTGAAAMYDMQKQQASAETNRHAVLKDLPIEAAEMLGDHLEVEAAELSETVASVEYGSMNGYLTYSEELKPGITYGVGGLTEGRKAEAVNELCGPPAFFERLGVEPAVGNTFSLSFRAGGEGMIMTREFVISGLVSQNDLSKLGEINDSRIVYGAEVSKALADELMRDTERRVNVSIRVKGEESLNYDSLCAKIYEVAADIGCPAENVDINKGYLMVMTDPGAEMTAIVCAAAVIIAVFSGMVIYSIYYVGVMTDVRGIGSLKALGASNRQIRRMMRREGLIVCLVSVPVGLALGYLAVRLAFPIVTDRLAAELPAAYAVRIEHCRMFSPVLLAAAAAVVLLTVYLSLLKPMRMAARISPVEAMRYTEEQGRKKQRRGRRRMSVGALMLADLTRNRKRTLVTMVTMGLSCVLFMSFAGIINSMSPEDIARREIEEGDFRIALEYSLNDAEYPENNLDVIQTDNPLGALSARIEAVDGVTAVTRKGTLSVSSDFDAPVFENGERRTVSAFDRADAERIAGELTGGAVDYDRMAAENGAVCANAQFMDEYGLELGDVIPLKVHDGENIIPLTVTIEACYESSDGLFLIPEEVYDGLGVTADDTTDLYISVDEEKYDSVKEALSEIQSEDDRLALYSMDEELRLGRASVSLVKYPMYIILILIAVIGFINLINTMVTSIVTRKREFGVLQAIGMSSAQLRRMLTGEGLVFSAGTLLLSATIGNAAGYLMYLAAKADHFMSISAYHYPAAETLMLAAVLALGQLTVTLIVNVSVKRSSITDRIRSAE